MNLANHIRNQLSIIRCVQGILYTSYHVEIRYGEGWLNVESIHKNQLPIRIRSNSYKVPSYYTNLRRLFQLKGQNPAVFRRVFK